MRIGMMTDMYKPHVSGITNYIELNKSHMESAGHEVYVFTFGDINYLDDDANVIRSPGLPIQDTGYYLNYRYSRQAKHLLQTMDLVHVHHPFISGRLALNYCRPLRIPIVFTNHTRYDLYAQAYLPLLPEEISATFLQSYMPNFCRAVDLVVSPSPGMAKVLRNLGVESPIEVIPNGVELKLYQESCGDCRQEFGFDEKDIILVYSGRLASEKNLDFLLKAFLGVADAVPSAHLLVIGGGPQEESLRQAASQSVASSRIHFTGMLPYVELPRLLAMCNLFITSSLTEVHPLSVIEAMASGLPALGIHSVGVGDTIEDGITGLLARDDLASFTAMLTRLCLEKDLRRKMGAAARMAAKKYAIEHTTSVMMKQYEKLIFSSGEQRKGLRYRLRSLAEIFRS
jgi:glycosyltransferase involved in cell wall biosynthesis